MLFMIDIERVRDNGQNQLHLSVFTPPDSPYIASSPITILKIPLAPYDSSTDGGDMFNWVEAKEGEKPYPGKVNQKGKPVRKQDKAFNKHTGRVDNVRLDKYRIMELLHQRSETPEKHQKMFSLTEPVVKKFCDIETGPRRDASGKIIPGFSAADEASGEILCYTMCDQLGNVEIMSCYDMPTTDRIRFKADLEKHFAKYNKKFNVTYRHFISESQMLMDFFYRIMPSVPFISGWNFLKYDWLYLVSRAKRLTIDYTKCAINSTFQTLSLADKWDKTKKTLIPVPLHKAVVDYLMIYEKWDMSIKLKTNNSLDAVSDELFGLGKQKYEGTLNDYWERDKYGYMLYNAIDTILVSMIDERLGTFKTMIALAAEGMVPLNDSMFASNMVSMLSYGYYIKKNIVFTATTAEDSTNSDISYTGGFVREPLPGIFNMVMVMDYESLFPSLMSAFNTGIEVLLGKTVKPGDKCQAGDEFWPASEYLKEEEHRDRSKLMKLNLEDHIWSAFGVVYDRKQESVMRLVVNKLLNNRVYNKNEGTQVENEILELKRMLSAIN